MAGQMAGVIFADKNQIDSLGLHGYCVSVVSKENRHSFHPEIGDFVDLLIGDTCKDERVRVRLVADQETPDGGVIFIYAAAAVAFKKDE